MRSEYVLTLDWLEGGHSVELRGVSADLPMMRMIARHLRATGQFVAKIEQVTREEINS